MIGTTRMTITHETLVAALQLYFDEKVFRDENRQTVKVINQKLNGVSGVNASFEIEVVALTKGEPTPP